MPKIITYLAFCYRPLFNFSAKFYLKNSKLLDIMLNR